MGIFQDWAKEKGFDFDFLNDIKPADVDSESGEETTNEDRARTGYSANYPPSYYAAQYPHKYNNPKKATADLDRENMGKKE